MNKFSKLAWFNLIWTVLVILWGAVVRATNSGAGCGKFWPLCGQSLIPTFDIFHTYIEFAHRVMSGILLVTIFAMFLYGRRLYKADKARRDLNTLVFVFLIIESLLGAGLVVFELVEDNDSILRIFAVSLHLLNTFVLVALTALNAYYSTSVNTSLIKLNVRKVSKIGLLLILVIGISGAVTSLADTLFPPSTFTETMNEWIDPTAHVLQRLRPYHPFFAIAFGLAIIAYLDHFFNPMTERGKKLKTWIKALIFVQFGLGMLNIVLHVPLYMQITHLLIAELIWITAIFLAFTADE